MASPIAVQKYVANPGCQDEYGLCSLRSLMGLGCFSLITFLFLRSEAGKLYYTLESPGGYAALHHQVSDSDLHGSWEFAFPTIFHEMPMLLLLEPHFESHCPRVWSWSTWSKLACLYHAHVCTLRKWQRKSISSRTLPLVWRTGPRSCTYLFCWHSIRKNFVTLMCHGNSGPEYWFSLSSCCPLPFPLSVSDLHIRWPVFFTATTATVFLSCWYWLAAWVGMKCSLSFSSVAELLNLLLQPEAWPSKT